MNVEKSRKFQGSTLQKFQKFPEFPGDKSFSRSFLGLENLKIKFQNFLGAVYKFCNNNDNNNNKQQ
jgi:hypothetical protein